MCLPNYDGRTIFGSLLDVRRLTLSPRRRGRAAGERYGEAERLGRLEVDHELELAGLLHRQIGWLFAMQNATRIYPPPAGTVRNATTVADKFRPLR